MQVSKIKDTFIERGMRVIKVLAAGFQFARTGNLVQAFGEDSNPTAWKPIFCYTENESQPIIIGFINPAASSNLAKGEKKIFSTKADGTEQFAITLRANATAEIGGNTDNMVRFSELQATFNQLRDDFNDLVDKYNAHTHISAAQGSPTAATTTRGTSSSADISGAKIEEIKTL